MGTNERIKVGDRVRSIYNKRAVYRVIDDLDSDRDLVRIRTIGAGIARGDEIEYTVRREILRKINVSG
jgi:hypothetical protein